MASTSHAQTHTSGPGACRESNKVTAQHTLERVRNNQRRHRARRRDYILMLEQKLSQAEQSVLVLRGRVDALQAELAQFRNQDGRIVLGCPVPPQQLQSDDNGRSPASPSLSSPRETDFQAFGFLWDPADLEIPTLSAPLPIQLPLSNDLSSELGPELVDTMSPYARPEDADESTESEFPRTLVPLARPSTCTCETSLAVVHGSAGVSGGCHSSSWSASALALQTTDYQPIGGTGTLLSATATADLISTTTVTCCSDGRFSEPEDDKTDEGAVILSREDPAFPEEYVNQPAMESHYIYETESELTTLCAEAYILIAQQNFKRLSQGDVAAWLWHGCRKSLRPGEGCRVKTDLLFSLLSFISDVWLYMTGQWMVSWGRAANGLCLCWSLPMLLGDLRYIWTCWPRPHEYRTHLQVAPGHR
jgi:hypothetical protein